jgi:hypothetical protein
MQSEHAVSYWIGPSTSEQGGKASGLESRRGHTPGGADWSLQGRDRGNVTNADWLIGWSLVVPFILFLNECFYFF